MNDDSRDALIHLRVPSSLKGRWVRESRAAGQRLTDWIVERVERSSHIAAGGAPDPVQEDLIAEARAEDAAGQTFGHAPGRAR